MFTPSAFSVFAAALCVLFVRADVVPNTPAQANVGAKCHITWQGDTTKSTTAWKDMTIALMTGSNSARIYLTGVYFAPLALQASVLILSMV